MPENEKTLYEQLQEQLSIKPETLEQQEKKEKAVVDLVSQMSVEDLRKALGSTKCSAIINQKGGVSKTVCTSNLAYVLAKRGFRVLAIDEDSQSSLSGLCNVLPNEYKSGENDEIEGLQHIYNAYVEKQGEISYEEDIKSRIIRPRYTELVRVKKENGKYDIVPESREFGFDLIPSDIELSGFDIKLARSSTGGVTLYNIVQEIKNARIKDSEGQDVPVEDFILVDCPPALTMLAYNGIGASSDGCIIPLNLEVMTLRGSKNVIDAIIEIQELFKKVNKVHKGILGMIKSQYVKRSRIQRDFEDVVRDFFPVRAFNTVIPNLAACDKAHARGMLFAQFDPKAFEAFDQIANEIIAAYLIRNDEEETVIVNQIDKEVSKKLYNEKAD